MQSAFELGEEFIYTLNDELAYNTLTYISVNSEPSKDLVLPEVASILTLSPSIGASPENIQRQRKLIDRSRRHSYREATDSLVSYTIGCCLGRWDVRLGISGDAEECGCEPTVELPSYPPGGLHDPMDRQRNVHPRTTPSESTGTASSSTTPTIPTTSSGVSVMSSK